MYNIRCFVNVQASDAEPPADIINFTIVLAQVEVIR